MERTTLNRTIISLIFASALLAGISVFAGGCSGGVDNTAELKKMPTASDTNNPDTARPKEEDLTFTDNPKKMKRP
jgi:pseudouridine-5'-phosphate glycosidase